MSEKYIWRLTFAPYKHLRYDVEQTFDIYILSTHSVGDKNIREQFSRTSWEGLKESLLVGIDFVGRVTEDFTV